MSQVMDVEQNVNDNVLTLPFMKNRRVEDSPNLDSYEAVKAAVESFDFDRALDELKTNREKEGPVIDLTHDLPLLAKAEIREMSTVEVYLNISQNLNSLKELVGKMKYFIDELESIEKNPRF